jgi:hypothetical protein
MLKVSQKFNADRIVIPLLVFHEYCITPAYIKRLLSDGGFTNIAVRNASLSAGSLTASFPFFAVLVKSVEILEKGTDIISGGRFTWGPSLDVIAKKI